MFGGHPYDDFEWDSSDGEPEHVLSQNDKALHDAITSNNLTAARHAIEILGADVNALIPNGMTMNRCNHNLYTARGNLDMMRLLLDHGANPNGKVVGSGQEYGFFEPPLHAISESKNTAAVKLLLQYGANVNIIGGAYGTPLEAACHYGHEPTVRVLLEAGADVNLQGGYHGDALQAAARYGRRELVMILLDAGADPTTQCGVCGSALKGARERDHPEVAKIVEDAIEKWKSKNPS